MLKLVPVRKTGAVELRPWRPSWGAYILLGAALLGAALSIAVVRFVDRSGFAEYEYHLWRWQADTFASSAFSLVGLGPEPDDAEGQFAVSRYFALTSQLRAEVEAGEPDASLVEALTNERAAYENDVEALMERYITEAVEDASLTRALPLFSAVSLTWPPVDFELTSPPRVLVRSPRNEIRRSGDTLLKNDLSLAQVTEIEERAEDDDTSTLVVTVGGIAAYPAIVRDDRTYVSVLNTASHEWVHHYLAFYPLGLEWARSQEGKTLNETVADIAGRAIADDVLLRHPIAFEEGLDGRAPPAPAAAASIDFNAEMRQLRLDVDALLAQGRVPDAELLMEERRQFLEENGVYIRRINQAYFAFYGSYGTSPESSDPIGEKLQRVWALTQDVGVFLTLVRDIQSASDLDELLARLEALATE